MDALGLQNIAALALNTQALGIRENLAQIVKAAHEAKKQGKSALFCGELSITGAECDDMFFSSGFVLKAEKLLQESLQDLPEDFIVGAGMPAYLGLDGEESSAQEDGGVLVNSYVLFSKEGVLKRVYGKFTFAQSRLDYSNRYFCALEPVLEDCSYEIGGKKIVIALGEASALFSNDIAEAADEYSCLICPTAVGYEADALAQRENIAMSISSCCNVPLVSINNVGCEGGSTVYDGQCLFIEDSDIIARNDPLSFKPYLIVTKETGVQPALNEYDEMLKAVALGLFDWMRKTHSKGFALSMSGGADSALSASCIAVAHMHALLDLGVAAYIDLLEGLGIKANYEQFTTDCVAAATHFGPYDSSLSPDQADGLSAALRKHIMPHILVCVYQSSNYSGVVTRTAAREMTACLGATFYEWSIAKVVEDYTEGVNKALGYKLSWDKDDIALQNIQARSRLPGIWMLANHKGFLLIATSNLSEAAVGYCTMDGDTAGGISPIAGISKSTILKMNSQIMHKGIGLNGFDISFKIPAMSYIVAQAPTAELRPGGEQTDEKDLMPYPLLDTIRALFTQECLLPEEICDVLCSEKYGKYKSVTTALGLKEDADIKRCVKRFMNLFQRNQWKRERYATCFHIMQDDPSPKRFLRFPVLSASLV